MQYIVSIDRVRSEDSTKIEESFSPEFLAIAEQDLLFTAPVVVEVELSLGGDFLLIAGNITTEAQCRCKICNELFPIPLSIDFHWTTEEDLSQELDLLPILREHILLEIPPFAECQDGNCPERKIVQNYFAKPEAPSSPFSDLDRNF